MSALRSLLHFIQWAVVSAVFLSLAWPALLFVYAYRLLGGWISTQLPASRLNPRNKHVFISGCDTGFGNMLAKQLDALGYSVFAGCLTDAAVQELHKECTHRIEAFKMDITNQEDVDRVAGIIRTRVDSLHAIVNNAGIAAGHMMDLTPIEHYEKVMAVNFFGHVRVTKSLWDLLARHSSSTEPEGRIVNITSIAGLISPPGMSAYCASKYAFEGFSDAIRREVRNFNVHVSIVEPGFLKTNIVTTAAAHIQGLWDSSPAAAKERWGEDWFAGVMGKSKKVLQRAESPQKAVDAVIDAVTSSSPKSRYLVGTEPNAIFPIFAVPAEISDPLVRLFASGRSKPVGIAAPKEKKF